MEFPQKLEFPDSVEETTHYRGLKPRIEYLKEDGNMEGTYLGQCLDSVRWGSLTTIMYEINALEMTSFIKNWMEQNKDDLKFHFVEPLPEFKLPYVDHDVCPRNPEHKMKVRALDGSIRCAETEKIEKKRNYFYDITYFDDKSKTYRKEYFHDHPEDEEEYRKYLDDTDMIKIKQRCSAIISEKESKLSLLDIINRRNISAGRRVFCKPYCNDEFIIDLYGDKRECFGHWPVKDNLVFSFDGWGLARNVEYWYNQEPVGTVPFTTSLVSKQVKKHLITPATTDLEKTYIEEIEKEIQKGISI